MKKSWIIWCLLACTVLLLPACKDDDVVNEGAEIRALFDKQQAELVAYIEDKGITATKDSRGIYREVVQDNPDGELIERGDVAILHYKITRLDGTLIDASAPEKPALITYSSERVYFPTALFYGLENVRVGGTYRYYVPSYYGYHTGSKKYSNDRGIQENAIIVLEYRIVDVAHTIEKIDEMEQVAIQQWLQAENVAVQALPNGIYKKVLKEGTGEMADAQDSVRLYYKGYYLNKKVFDENTSGDGFAVIVDKTGVIKGFTQAIKTMKLGEKSMFILPSNQAYGRVGAFVFPHDDFKAMQDKGVINASLSAVPPFSTLIFELELRSLTKK